MEVSYLRVDRVEMSKEDATIRQINIMLREIETIETHCTDGRAKRNEQKQDPFSAEKRELHQLLQTLKAVRVTVVSLASLYMSTYIYM